MSQHSWLKFKVTDVFARRIRIALYVLTLAMTLLYPVTLLLEINMIYSNGTKQVAAGVDAGVFFLEMWDFAGATWAPPKGWGFGCRWEIWAFHAIFPTGYMQAHRWGFRCG